MDYDIEDDGTRMAVRVVGDLDAAGADRLRDAVVTVLVAGPRDVEIDLTAVGFLDCAGLGSLRAVHDAATGTGGSVLCVCPEGEPRALLRLTGAQEWLHVTGATVAPAHEASAWQRSGGDRLSSSEC